MPVPTFIQSTTGEVVIVAHCVSLKARWGKGNPLNEEIIAVTIAGEIVLCEIPGTKHPIEAPPARAQSLLNGLVEHLASPMQLADELLEMSDFISQKGGDI